VASQITFEPRINGASTFLVILTATATTATVTAKKRWK